MTTNQPNERVSDSVEEFNFKAIKEYWAIHVGPKSSQHMQEKVLHKVYLKLQAQHEAQMREVVGEVYSHFSWCRECSEGPTCNDALAIAAKHGINLDHPLPDNNPTT